MTAKKLGVLFAATSVAALALTACSSSDDTKSDDTTPSNSITAPEETPSSAVPTALSDADVLSEELIQVSPADYLKGTEPIFSQHVIDPEKGVPYEAIFNPVTLTTAVVVEMGTFHDPGPYYAQFYRFDGKVNQELAKVDLKGPAMCEPLSGDLGHCRVLEGEGEGNQAYVNYFVDMKTGAMTKINRVGQGSLLHENTDAETHTFLWFDAAGKASLLELNDQAKVVSETPTKIQVEDAKIVEADRVGDLLVVPGATLWDAAGNTKIAAVDNCAGISDGVVCLDFSQKQVVGYTADGTVSWTEKVEAPQQIWAIGVTPTMTLAETQTVLHTIKFPGAEVEGYIGITPKLAYFAGRTATGVYWLNDIQVAPAEIGPMWFDTTNPEIALGATGGDVVGGGMIFDPSAVTPLAADLSNMVVHYYWNGPAESVASPTPSLLLGYDVVKGDIQVFKPAGK